MSGPYPREWPNLWNAGFTPFPLPAGKKEPPPGGVTGEFGVSPSYADCWAWAEDPQWINGNIGIRLNKGSVETGEPGVIVLDVDHYEKAGKIKRGADAIVRQEAIWGPLPVTWRSTARGADNPSGGRLYRVPPGTKIDASILGDVDALHYGWRYLVVAPSINPLTGTQYQWNTPDDHISLTTPLITWLPYLPPSWGQGLIQRPEFVTHVASAEVEKFFASLPRGEQCAAIKRALASIVAKFDQDGVKRHEAALRGVMRLCYLGEQGHPGAMEAISNLSENFVTAVKDDRGERVAKSEFQRMIIASDGRSKAVSLILSSPTPEYERGCFCDLTTRQRPPTLPQWAATNEEIASFLATFTRFGNPGRLGHRVAWMKADSPDQLYRHTRAMVLDVIVGYYPANRAVSALLNRCRAINHTDPDIPRRLLAIALGSVLNAKVAA